MIIDISIDEYLAQYEHLPMVDVRSPGEFERGHIPGAKNIALFSDDERAHIGTVYKQVSKDDAIKLGYQYVTPKLTYFIDASKALATNGEIVVHCWRGGMRSRAFADHLNQNGFEKVYVIKRGYKAFRRLCINTFEKTYQLKVLGGNTGSGKTDILKALAQKGEQVIDLENLANHRGSAFGGIDLGIQPTSEQFENNLFTTIQKLNNTKPIWVEDESINIGSVFIPQPFFSQMRQARVYFINIPIDQRAEYLEKTYGQLSKEGLMTGIQKITKRLGYNNAKDAEVALELNQLRTVAKICLVYYDKGYFKGLSRRDPNSITMIESNVIDADKNADLLINTKHA